MAPDRRAQLKVSVALAVLVGVQATAMAIQLAHGFFPFRSPPSRRVPYSWDMFALPVDRCDLRWTPPLPAAGGIASLGAAGRTLEWWPIFDRVADYEREGREGCKLATDPTRVELRCLLVDGGSVDRGFDCP